MNAEDNFQRKLDAYPVDWEARLALSEWLEAQSDPRAIGYRALAVQWRHPMRGERAGGWWWFNSFGDETLPESLHNDLPPDWFAALPAGEGDDLFWPVHREGSGRKSRRECEDAAALAFTHLPPGRRAELLGGPLAEGAYPRIPAPSPIPVEPGARVWAVADSEDDFRAALASNPTDWSALLAFADWLAARGDTRAPGYRALALMRRSPAVGHKVDGGLLWDWLTGESARFYVNRGNDVGRGLLPYDWHELLPEYSVRYERHETLAVSLDDAALAFAALPAERKAELLGASSTVQ